MSLSVCELSVCLVREENIEFSGAGITEGVGYHVGLGNPAQVPYKSS